MRASLVSQQTAMISQIRGFLFERGIAVGQGLCFLRQQLPETVHTEVPTTDIAAVFCNREPTIDRHLPCVPVAAGGSSESITPPRRSCRTKPLALRAKDRYLIRLNLEFSHFDSYCTWPKQMSLV